MRFRFTHIHIVEAQTRDEAMIKFVDAIKSNTVEKYFVYCGVKIEEKPKGVLSQSQVPNLRLIKNQQTLTNKDNYSKVI